MAKNKSSSASSAASNQQGKAPQPQPTSASRVPSLNHDPESWELKREEQRYSKTRPQLFLNSTVRVPSINGGEPVHVLTGWFFRKKFKVNKSCLTLHVVVYSTEIIKLVCQIIEIWQRKTSPYHYWFVEVIQYV